MPMSHMSKHYIDHVYALRFLNAQAVKLRRDIRKYKQLAEIPKTRTRALKILAAREKDWEFLSVSIDVLLKDRMTKIARDNIHLVGGL